MSYWLSETQIRDWADKHLKHYLDPDEYPAIFAALRTAKHTQRLKRVELGLLKMMFDRYRPERSEDEGKRYADSNAVKVPEIADALKCNVTTVRRAKERINNLVRDGARKGTHARKHGLLLFHDMGIFFHATFWDASRAKDYSEKMASSQIDVHAENIALADETRHSVALQQERLNKFSSLSPTQQARLLEQLAAVPA